MRNVAKTIAYPISIFLSFSIILKGRFYLGWQYDMLMAYIFFLPLKSGMAT